MFLQFFLFEIRNYFLVTALGSFCFYRLLWNARDLNNIVILKTMLWEFNVQLDLYGISWCSQAQPFSSYTSSKLSLLLGIKKNEREGCQELGPSNTKRGFMLLLHCNNSHDFNARRPIHLPTASEASCSFHLSMQLIGIPQVPGEPNCSYY